jgi:pimeloyl-ACP methyl ester carboxylesterase
VAALVIGGEKDEMMPPDDVRRVFAALGERDKQLWIVPGALHGHAITDQPAEYARRLAELLDKVAPR